MKKNNRNLTLNLKALKEEKNSYHSSFTSKGSENEENKKLSKKINKAKTNKFLKPEIINKILKEKDDILSNVIKTKKTIDLNDRKKLKTNINKKKESKSEKKEEKKKEVKIKDEKKKDKIIINKYLLKVQKPIIIDELPKQKHACFLGNKSIKSIYKLIQIYIFHREEIFLIKINNGLTVNDLIYQILQKIKIVKEELELFLIYEIFDIKNNISIDKNISNLFKNLSYKQHEKVNKIKTTIIELLKANNNYNNINNSHNDAKHKLINSSHNDAKHKLLIFPDIENKYKNLKIKDLLNNKINCYIKANQVSKNKYNANYYYRNEIKNINTNSFISNVNKEIEKNNMLLSKHNNNTVDVDKSYKEIGIEIGIKSNYKNVVIVEGIDLISDFLNEIETFLKEKEIKENYNWQNIGKGKYSFCFQRKDIAYDFHKYVNLLQLVNKKYFGIRCRLKLYNIKNLKYNSSEKNNLNKSKFFFKDKFNNNDYFVLKNNLCGPFNSYFLNKGQKKYILNDNDTESMNEIVKLNKYKFKNTDMNY